MYKCDFFFFKEKTHQGKALRTYPWIVNLRYTTPPIRTVYWVIQGKLLVGIEARMSESTAHPKPPTTRLHPDAYVL